MSNNYYPDPVSCTYKNGSLPPHPTPEFSKLTATWPPSDSTIQSLQPWIPGQGKEGNVFRNSYSVTDDKGRLKTSTHVYPALPGWKKNDIPDELEHRVGTKDIKATKLVATAMCASFDAATKQLVRYVEEVRKVRVVRIWVDYVVDTNSQLWFNDCGGVVVATGKAAVDLRSVSSRDPRALIHATGAKATGRSGFLGEAGAEMEEEELEKVQGLKGMVTPMKRRKQGGKRFDHETEERNRMYEQQILEAENRTETYGMRNNERTPTKKGDGMNKNLIAPHFDSHQKNHNSSLPSVPALRPNSQGEARRHVNPKYSASKTSASKSLPTQFKCHGQFCDLHTVDPAPLQSNEEDGGSNRERALRIAKQVLSVNEMKNLESSGKLLMLGIQKRGKKRQEWTTTP